MKIYPTRVKESSYKTNISFTAQITYTGLVGFL
jgi:hypothetical protein